MGLRQTRRINGLTSLLTVVMTLAALVLTVFTPFGPLKVARADATYFALSGGNFSQNWTNTGLITTSNDWSGVPGIVGYRGDELTTGLGVDPQTILSPTTDTSTNPVNVNANQANPNTFTTGGVAEFEITDPTVALQGSGTADAPNLVLFLDATGRQDVTVSYNLRDIDGSADNAVQPVALQYRVGTSSNFTNVPAAFVADASSGPSLATLVTPVSAVLPASVNNQAQVQVRIITSNAVPSDEWIGVDDIAVTSAPTSGVSNPTGTGAANPASILVGNTSLLTVTVTPGTGPTSTGLSVTGDLTAIGGPASQTFFDDGTNGDLTAGDNVFSFLATVNAATTAGVKSLPFSISDAEARTGTGNISLTVTTPVVATFIREIQGITHLSPKNGQTVSAVPGIVTAKRTNGYYLQDPTPDSDDRTSEGIFVFTSSAPAVTVGDSVTVNGTVSEFRPGGSGGLGNLTITEITNPATTIVSSGNALPAPIVVGTGGRVPPTTVIKATPGDVETLNAPLVLTDGLDFYESLEGMRLQVNNPVAVGPTTAFGEIAVLSDNGTGAGVRTPRGGIIIRPGDFNPERIILDDTILATPIVNVGDHFSGPAVGVLDYSFGNFKLNITQAITAVSAGLTPEVTLVQGPNQLAIATFNVENLDPGDGAPKFQALAGLVVNNLKSPDLIALEEIQDNNGATDNGTVDADVTINTLIQAITTAGGPTYQYRQISPVNDQNGGEPGGNIRVVFLFRTDRGLSFVDRPGGTSTAAVSVVGSPAGPQLSFSPGLIDPTNPAFNSSRKPLAGEFLYHGQKVFVVANHFNSKGGDQPLFGRNQPPTLTSETQRRQQAQIVRNFINSLLALDSKANAVVLGDLNDFQFSAPLTILKCGSTTPCANPTLHALIETLPENERYTYVFDGNSQAIDHILLSDNLFTRPFEYDVLHVNSEFSVRASDHDPQIVRLTIPAAATTCAVIPTGSFCAEYFNNKTLTAPSVLVRNESYPIRYSLGAGSPAPGVVNADNYSARWIGNFAFATTDTYIFSTRADDGVRVYLDGVLVVDHWTSPTPILRLDGVRVTAGTHQVKVEYYEATGDSTVQVTWATKGRSRSSVNPN